MQLPQLVEVKGIRVLTTKQLAELYGADTRTLQYNFRYNKERYILGKHYIEVNGDELRRLKTRSEIPSSFKYAKSLYLWTEKGALLHAKSLNTDKAWEVYDYLVDFYFRAQVKQTEPAKKEPVQPKPIVRMVVDIPENTEAQEAIRDLKKALNAIEVMVDESNRYISKDSYYRHQGGVTDALAALISRTTNYLNIVPGLIEKQY
ncbi:MAG: ORF6N domain-containing protein [Lachnospiraceae bacterium]